MTLNRSMDLQSAYFERGLHASINTSFTGALLCLKSAIADTSIKQAQERSRLEEKTDLNQDVQGGYASRPKRS